MRNNKLRFAMLMALSSSQAMAGDVVLDNFTAGNVADDVALTRTGGTTFNINQNQGITNGTNLFHSFRSFNIDAGETAAFNGSGITNIISRVTGGSTTTINGTVRSNIAGANFWFVNPAGITIGSTGVIDVSGAVALGAVDSVLSGIGTGDPVFDAHGSNAVTFSVNPHEFGFLSNSTAGSLTIRSQSFLSNETVVPTSRRIGVGISYFSDVVTPDGTAIPLLERIPDGFSRLLGGHAGVVLESANISLVNTKVETANARGPQLNTSSGSIQITAAQSLVVRESALTTQIEYGANTAASGNITLQSGSINIGNSGLLTSSGPSGASIVLTATNADTSSPSAVTPALAVDNSWFYTGAPRIVGGGNAGRIQFSAALGSLRLTDANLLTSVYAGGTAPSDITLSARRVEVGGGLMAASTQSNNAANIRITATGVDQGGIAALRIYGGAVLESTALSYEALSVGNSGQVVLAATNGTMRIEGNGTAIVTTSGARGRSELGRTGNAGSILAAARNFQLFDGALLNSSVFSAAETADNPGSITVNATENIHLVNGRIEANALGLVGSFGAPGRIAGDIELTANSILVDGSSIAASTLGTGAAGSVDIVALGADSVGTAALRIENGSTIESTASGQTGTYQGRLLPVGNAGSVSVSSPVGTTVIGGAGSRVSTSASVDAGNAGIVEITGRDILVASGAEVSTTVASAASISARPASILISGTNSVRIIDQRPSSVGLVRTSVLAETTGGRDAGAITVTGGTAGVTIDNGTLSTSTVGTGTAGDITIGISTNAASQIRIANSSVTTTASIADGGDITINANGDQLTLDRTIIGASAGEQGQGGDITINNANGQAIIQGSQILAQADDGDGGAIFINNSGGQLIRDSQTVINADSSAGNNGTVSISSPNTDLNSAIKAQEVDVATPPELGSNACVAGKTSDRSTFVRENRGGVAARPDSYLATRLVGDDTATRAAVRSPADSQLMAENVVRSADATLTRCP